MSVFHGWMDASKSYEAIENGSQTCCLDMGRESWIFAHALSATSWVWNRK